MANLDAALFEAGAREQPKRGFRKVGKPGWSPTANVGSGGN
jgi:hypothetical protein